MSAASSLLLLLVASPTALAQGLGQSADVELLTPGFATAALPGLPGGIR